MHFARTDSTSINTINLGGGFLKFMHPQMAFYALYSYILNGYKEFNHDFLV